MELNNKINDDGILIGTVLDNHQFTISNDSQPIIIDSLINLYEDPIGSIVREITSNCIDAHKERDLKLVGRRPLEVGDDINYFSRDKHLVEVIYAPSYELNTNSGVMIFRDYGVGLNEDRVKQVFTVFGSSSKRVDNEEIGGFGLGAKSPFAYTNVFYIKTYVNGTQSLYLLSRGTSIPTMEKIYEEKVHEMNRTEVIIPLQSQNDLSKFVNAIRKQLRYFPEILYNISNYDLSIQPKISIQTEDFLYDLNEAADYYAEPNILIGNVAYPYNWSLIGTKYRPDKGTKLKFQVGELDLVPSRESIRYTENTIQKINEKLERINNYISQEIENAIAKEKDILMQYTYFRYFTYGANISKEQAKNIKVVDKLYTLTHVFSTYKYDPTKRFNIQQLKQFQLFTIIVDYLLRVYEIRIKGGKVYSKEEYYMSGKLFTELLFGVSRVQTYYKPPDVSFDKARNLYYPNITVISLYNREPDGKIIDRTPRGKDGNSVDLPFGTSEADITTAINIIKKALDTLPLYTSIPKAVEVKGKNARIIRTPQNLFYRRATLISSYYSTIEWSNRETSLKTLQENHTIVYGFEKDKKVLEAACLVTDYVIIRVSMDTADFFKGLPNIIYIYDFIKNNETLYNKYVMTHKIIKAQQAYWYFGQCKHIDALITQQYERLSKLKNTQYAEIKYSEPYSKVEERLKAYLDLTDINDPEDAEYTDIINNLKQLDTEFEFIKYLNLTNFSIPEAQKVISKTINIIRGTNNGSI